MQAKLYDILIGWLRCIKRIISRSRLGAAISTKIQRSIFKLAFKDHEALFTYYYKSNKWGDSESVSGPGSSLEATENIRRELPLLFGELNIKVLFDAPCGDFNWFRRIEIQPAIRYIGGEIVESIVEKNHELFKDINRRFIKVDITKDELPQADMWLCRDTLFHFSNEEICKVISNLRKSNISYFLSTTFPEVAHNKDIRMGEYRPINLERFPFNLHAPLRYINDSDSVTSGKKLGLWKF
jgi:hypothetical protein